MRYVGMPYRLGGNPAKGRGTDCIQMVLSVLRDAGLEPPPVERRWYQLLAQHDLAAIQRDWFTFTEQTLGPEQCAMTLLPNEGDFSIAVVVDNGLLAVKATVGVVWGAAQQHAAPELSAPSECLISPCCRQIATLPICSA
jgi:hypothetical protein